MGSLRRPATPLSYPSSSVRTPHISGALRTNTPVVAAAASTKADEDTEEDDGSGGGGGGGTGENLARARERESKTQQHGAPENSPSAVAHFKQRAHTHTHTHTHTLHRGLVHCKKVRRKTRPKTFQQQEGSSYERGRFVRQPPRPTEQRSRSSFHKASAAASQKPAHPLLPHTEPTRDPGTDCLCGAQCLSVYGIYNKVVGGD